MLSTPTFNPSKVDLDLSFARSAGDLVTHDLPRLVRKADVPHRVEAGVDAVADAARSALDQLPGRRQHRSRSMGTALVFAGLLALLAATGLLMVRMSTIATARRLDRELDEEALERATTDGMATAGTEAGTATDEAEARVPVGVSA
jgi:hypothetical protein